VTLNKAVAALLAAGLIEERGTTKTDTEHRTDGDLSYALHILPAGLTAIGIEPPTRAIADHVAANPSPASRQTKATAMLALLQLEGGATLAELIAATAWLPHTTRAALTGLRKKGHDVQRSKRDDGTCYGVMAG
jgi:hypothetical protein